MAVIEKWKDGVLISTEEVEDFEQVDETVLIPKSAITQLADAMTDPSINSIAEVKSAISDFVEKIQ